MDGSDEEHCHLWQEDMVIAGLDLKAVLSTHDSLSVTWWLSNPGQKNLEYKFGRSYHGHKSWTNVTDTWSPADSHSAVFTSLSPASDYDLRVFVRDSSTGHEYGHAPVVRGRTSDWIPDCTDHVSTHQLGADLVITWTWPHVTNGDIVMFQLNVWQDGNIVREHEVLVPANTSVRTMNTTLYGLQYNVQYSIQIIPANSQYKADGCDKHDVKLVDMVRSLHVGNVEDRSVGVSWDCDHEGVQYQVCYTSYNPLEPGQVCKVTDNKAITLSGFSPATKYTISVHVQTNEASKSHPKITEVTTKGDPLPKVTNVVGALHDSSPTEVKLTWDIDTENNYQFGVWYGVSMDKLLKFKPTLIRDNKVTIVNTAGCTDYIFVVAIFDEEKYGVGPASDPVHVTTRYSDTSPPRHVTREGNDTITWSAPCEVMPGPVRYHLTLVISDIYNETRADTDHVTLAATRDVTMSHKLDQLAPGSMVSVTVKTDNSEESLPVKLYGPPLASPVQVLPSYLIVFPIIVSIFPGKCAK